MPISPLVFCLLISMKALSIPIFVGVFALNVILSESKIVFPSSVKLPVTDKLLALAEPKLDELAPI